MRSRNRVLILRYIWLWGERKEVCLNELTENKASVES